MRKRCFNGFDFLFQLEFDSVACFGFSAGDVVLYVAEKSHLMNVIQRKIFNRKSVSVNRDVAGGSNGNIARCALCIEPPPLVGKIFVIK